MTRVEFLRKVLQVKRMSEYSALMERNMKVHKDPVVAYGVTVEMINAQGWFKTEEAPGEAPGEAVVVPTVEPEPAVELVPLPSPAGQSQIGVVTHTAAVPGDTSVVQYVPPPDADELIEKPKKRKGKEVAEGMVSAEVFKDKKPVTERQVIQWVFDWLAVDDVEAAQAPSAGAWGLLLAIRENPQLKLEFFKTIWPKLLPTKTQLESGERFEDTGQEQLSLLDKLLRTGGKGE